MSGPTGYERAMMVLDDLEVPRYEDGEAVTTERLEFDGATITQWVRVRPYSLPQRIRLLSQAVPELMGTYEAARELGVTTSNLGGLKGLPAPVAELRMGKVWRAADIRALAERRRQR